MNKTKIYKKWHDEECRNIKKQGKSSPNIKH